MKRNLHVGLILAGILGVVSIAIATSNGTAEMVTAKSTAATL